MSSSTQHVDEVLPLKSMAERIMAHLRSTAGLATSRV